MILDEILYLNRDVVISVGYIATFLFTFLEASPLIGLFIPGATILFFAGFLAKFNFLNFWWVLLVGILGAILGDVGGYIFGRYAGKEFLHRYGGYFLIKKSYIERACGIVDNHTGKSLIIGRLSPVTRTVAPFIVGAHGVKFSKFMIFNIIGGILWGIIFVSLGYLFGQSYAAAIKFEKQFIVITILLLVMIYGYYVARLLYRKINSKDACKLTEHGFDSKK
ncbi:MAG: DedA family protein [archaeon]